MTWPTNSRDRADRGDHWARQSRQPSRPHAAQRAGPCGHAAGTTPSFSGIEFTRPRRGVLVGRADAAVEAYALVTLPALRKQGGERVPSAWMPAIRLRAHRVAVTSRRRACSPRRNKVPRALGPTADPPARYPSSIAEIVAWRFSPHYRPRTSGCRGTLTPLSSGPRPVRLPRVETPARWAKTITLDHRTSSAQRGRPPAGSARRARI